MIVDSNLTAIILIGIIALVPISIVAVTKISDMKLKIEQIRAQTAIKTEEIQAKNKLDIEKLMMQDNSEITQEKPNNSFPISGDSRLPETKNRRNKIDA